MGTLCSPWLLRFTEQEFRELSLLVADRADICLGSGVREHITRLARQQMAALGITRFSEYLRRLESDPAGSAIRELCRDLKFARLEKKSLRRQDRYTTEWAHAAC